MPVSYTEIAARLAAAGLVPRGGFEVRPDDRVPPLADGRSTLTLVLVGNTGASLWPAFAASPERASGIADPLDAWTRRVLDAIAAEFGAQALYPFGRPPHHPFQRWAQRAEAVHRSPLGLLIHAKHGLWHAWRGALAFAEEFAVPAHDHAPSPCESCSDRPCLAACPVGAFAGAGYDVAACVRHLDRAAGQDCMDGGCLARRACPVGAPSRYDPAQQSFHMRAFLAVRRAGHASP